MGDLRGSFITRIVDIVINTVDGYGSGCVPVLCGKNEGCILGRSCGVGIDFDAGCRGHGDGDGGGWLAVKNDGIGVGCSVFTDRGCLGITAFGDGYACGVIINDIKVWISISFDATYNL